MTVLMGNFRCVYSQTRGIGKNILPKKFWEVWNPEFAGDCIAVANSV